MALVVRKNLHGAGRIDENGEEALFYRLQAVGHDLASGVPYEVVSDPIVDRF